MTPSGRSRFSKWTFEYAVRPSATAGFFVLVALFWTLLLQHVFVYPFLFLFLGAIMGSAWFGGAVAGAASVALSTAAIAYFFVPPLFSWSVEPTSKTYFVAFVVCAIAVSGMSSAMKRAKNQIREARDNLEHRVLERTAELERSNLEIQDRERRLRMLTEAIPQQIWSADTDGEVEYCNHHLLNYLGRTMDDVRGDRFFQSLHPEDQVLFRGLWREAVDAGQVFESECRVRGVHGQFRWFLVRSVPQKTAQGEITRWYGTHIDIEDRRRAEQYLIKVQEEFSQLSRALSLGELAVSIAHEINQPLTAIVTHAYACVEWLKCNPANLPKASTTAERIVQESTRAAAIVARIRSLFQRDLDPREPVDINLAIQGLLKFLRDEALRREITIRTELGLGLPPVDADRIQIQQVMLNLVMNGMDSMVEMKGARELLISTASNNGQEIVVRVEDSGVGVPAEIATRIFDPFFSTKPHGIGVGLSISRSIIEAHEGRLWMTARPSGGTTFQFTIPVRL